MSEDNQRGGESETADVEWGYSGKSGPENWQNLSPNFGICKTGKNQSPINLASTNRQSLPSMVFEYETKAETIHRTETQVRVSFPEGNSLKVDGQRFDLEQFHFHTPAEHRIDGKEFPLELHLVHKNEAGDIAVVAVLFERGEVHDGIYRVINYIPSSMGETRNLETADIKPVELLPSDTSYYRYNGSLTTPPCQEGVRWFVMKQTPSVSASQIDSFKRSIREPNARPIQPLNARIILE